MSYRRDKAQRAAFGDVGATCPAVDSAERVAAAALADAATDALATFTEAVKEQTNALRDALVQAHERIIELEDEVGELKEQLRAAEEAVA